MRRLCLSEALGTYLLVFLGPASVVIAYSSPALTPFEAQEAVAAVFGLIVLGVIVLLGWVSGANINPAITVAAAAARRLRWSLVAPYVLSQVTGALLAGLTLRVVFEGASPALSLGSTKLAPSVTPLEGLALEFAGTLVLALSALAAGSRLRTVLSQGALVGGTLFVLISLVGPFTSASFNPVRSLGPSLFSWYLDDQLVYYAGPVLGGLAAGLIFARATKNVKRSEAT